MKDKKRLNSEELRQALRHVLWIGGAPDAGKTSVARVLVEKYDLQFYGCDDHAEAHWVNHISQNPAAFGHTWLKLSEDERWLQSPENLFQSVQSIVADDFPFIIKDLLAMPEEPLILVEGNLPPKLIEPFLTDRRQAIWMVPTDTFYEASFFRREKHLGHRDRSDPKQTQANHMARDRLTAEYIKEETLSRKLVLLEIGGVQSLNEVVTIVEHHFASFLNPLHSEQK